jgi:hypothetical protein
MMEKTRRFHLLSSPALSNRMTSSCQRSLSRLRCDCGTTVRSNLKRGRLDQDPW